MQTEEGRKKQKKGKLFTGDAGVSLALATEFNWGKRIPLLLIHGMLHLVGYDHEKNKDWKLMTQREEEVINKFKERYTPLSPDASIDDCP